MKSTLTSQNKIQAIQKYDLLKLGFNYSKYQECIAKLDEEKIKKYNLRYPKGTDFHLHDELTPCPFEGNLLKANIFLLLTNPGISPASTQATHNLYIEEWGITNLSTLSTSNWYRPRFKKLLDDPEDENEWKELSNKIAMIQAVPWASKRAKTFKLPSSDLMLDLVRELAKINQKSIFIIMRNKKFWMQALHQTDQSRVIINPNPRNTFISKGNIGTDWVKIKQALINSESNLI